MSLKTYLHFFVIGLALLVAESLAAGEFSKPNDTVGYANCYGNLQFTGHLGEVKFSNSEVYSLYFQYSSYSEYESPFLGKGFFVPLLEAVLIDHDHYLEATTLGGSTIYMYRLPAEPDRYVSLNGKNSARKLGGDKFIRETKDGFKLEYHQGQLNRVQTPKGAQLLFEYDDELCKTIRSSTGAAVCSINKTSDQRSVLITAEGRYEMEYQKHPISNDASIHPAELPPLYTLKTIAWPNGAETQFSYTSSEESDDIKLQMRYQDDVADFIWNKRNDQLISADKVGYVIMPLLRDSGYNRERTVTGIYSIRQRFEDGSMEVFSHDEDSGYSDVEKSNGNIIRTHYINTRGPVFNMVSKKERINNHFDPNKAEVFYEAFYDVEGNLLRQVRDGKITWHIRKGGIPGSVVKDDDNMYRYDEKGRVVASRYDDSVTRVQWLKGDVSRVVSSHPWGEINLRYFDAFGNPLPIPSKDKFEEKKSL